MKTNKTKVNEDETKIIDTHEFIVKTNHTETENKTEQRNKDDTHKVLNEIHKQAIQNEIDKNSDVDIIGNIKTIIKDGNIICNDVKDVVEKVDEIVTKVKEIVHIHHGENKVSQNKTEILNENKYVCISINDTENEKLEEQQCKPQSKTKFIPIDIETKPNDVQNTSGSNEFFNLNLCNIV